MRKITFTICFLALLLAAGSGVAQTWTTVLRLPQDVTWPTTTASGPSQNLNSFVATTYGTSGTNCLATSGGAIGAAAQAISTLSSSKIKFKSVNTEPDTGLELFGTTVTSIVGGGNNVYTYTSGSAGAFLEIDLGALVNTSTTTTLNKQITQQFRGMQVTVPGGTANWVVYIEAYIINGLAGDNTIYYEFDGSGGVLQSATFAHTFASNDTLRMEVFYTSGTDLLTFNLLVNGVVAHTLSVTPPAGEFTTTFAPQWVTAGVTNDYEDSSPAATPISTGEVSMEFGFLMGVLGTPPPPVTASRWLFVNTKGKDRHEKPRRAIRGSAFYREHGAGTASVASLAH